MSKAFTKETDEADEIPPMAPDALPPGVKNYVTPQGYRALRHALDRLLAAHPPPGEAAPPHAADPHIALLARRLESAVVIDPAAQQQRDQVHFGATVTYADAGGATHTVTLVGVDEADPARGRISFIAPLARALMAASVGDTVELDTPAGAQQIEVLAIDYPRAEARR